MSENKYTFGEKETEWSSKDNKEIEVWKSPKYEVAKKAVIKMLESEEYKDVLDEGDFWILMNRTKSGKMAYTGLIISHNGCLKINDTLPDELKFNPRCVSYYSNNADYATTYNASLIFEYDSSKLEDDKQRIFEIGEVSEKNCKNDYPYAMALKRCMDRVILKNSKLAYSGVYSDSEAEEFAEKDTTDTTDDNKKFIPATDTQLDIIKGIFDTKEKKIKLKETMTSLGKVKIEELSIQEASEIIKNERE